MPDAAHSAQVAPLVFIVDDDPQVARTLALALQGFAFATRCCHTGAELLRHLARQSPDLCIIDLGLPDMDGMQLMQEVRQKSACGVLILTGRGHVSDRVMGLELGADDYMVKPCETRELVARCRSILRRRQSAEMPAPAGMPVAEFSGWRFNPANNTLYAPDGGQQVLSTAEAELLGIFLAHPNRILERERLLGRRELSASDRSIDARVSRLRRKLDGDEPRRREIIKTVYGAGYLFLSPVRWQSAAPDESASSGATSR
jgi:DNA-binding response OmpR family regulator